MAEIEDIYIHLRRWVYSPRDDLLHLEVRARVNGKPNIFNKVLPEDDFKSNFDVIWKFAGEEIQDFLLKEREDGKVRTENSE